MLDTQWLFSVVVRNTVLVMSIISPCLFQQALLAGFVGLILRHVTRMMAYPYLLISSGIWQHMACGALDKQITTFSTIHQAHFCLARLAGKKGGGGCSFLKSIQFVCRTETDLSFASMGDKSGLKRGEDERSTKASNMSLQNSAVVKISHQWKITFPKAGTAVHLSSPLLWGRHVTLFKKGFTSEWMVNGLVIASVYTR